MWGKFFGVKTEDGERIANFAMSKVYLTDKEFEEVRPVLGILAIVILVILFVMGAL